MGRRVLITGLSTFWGGRLAQALEADPTIDVIVGLDTRDPQVALERTEFIRSDPSYSILSRIVRATRVDTVLHTFLVVDATVPEARSMDEINVIGTSNLCAAAGAPGSTVRTVVVKSSTIVYGASRQDPAFFAESTPRSHPPRTRLERSLAEVEHYVHDFALDHPETAVSILRYCNVVGPDMTGSLAGLLARPFVPSVQGFDPLLQVVHEDDVVRSLRFAMDQGLRGTFNVAGDGLLPWSEVVAIAGRRRWPLPAVATEEVARGLRLAGVVKISAELLGLLRYGRGVDNSALKRAGFEYLYDTAAAVAEHVAPSGCGERSAKARRTAAAARTSRSSCAAPPPSCASRRSPAERRPTQLISATGTERPAVDRTVAIERPGWTAGFASPTTSGPSLARAASSESTVMAMPKNRAGPPAGSGSGGPTTSRITSPMRKKAWRIGRP